MERIRAAHVALFGLGGVGSYAFEALARAGVGRLTLVDADVFDPTNLNRQLLALDDTIGRPKVEVARERASRINPGVEITCVQEFVTPDNAAAMLPGDATAAIDAIDTLASKLHLLLAMHGRGLSFISVMGAASRLDPLGVRVADISATKVCPLAREMRRMLKKAGVVKGVPCVYSEENTSRSLDPPQRMDGALRKRIMGSISYMPAIMGLTAAGWILRRILYGEVCEHMSRTVV